MDGMDTVTHADHPDYVTVAVAKKGERALADRFRIGGLLGGHKQVGPDFLVRE